MHRGCYVGRNYADYQQFLLKHSNAHTVQTDIDHMINYINSYSIAKFSNRRPYEVFTFYYGSEALEKLGYSQIDPSCVVITPKLFKR